MASTTGTVNVTPLTEMLLAAASGGAPSALFAAAKPDLAGVSSKLPTALATVKARLDSLGVDTTNLPKNPLSDKFTPAIGNGAGDAADKVLDDLKLKLGSTGKTLASLAGEVAIGQTTNTPVATGTGTGTSTSATNTTTSTTTVVTNTSTGTTTSASPSVTSFTPNQGPVSTSVSITGLNLGLFTPAPLVKFGTTNAGGPYTNVSNTNVTVKVPAGLALGVHAITIANGDGRFDTGGHLYACHARTHIDLYKFVCHQAGN